MKIISKYAGQCFACGQPIAVGDEIEYVHDQRPRHWRCPVQKTQYDNRPETCAKRATEQGLPAETSGGNRPMLVQCQCGHLERYDLLPRYESISDPRKPAWRDSYLLPEDPSDDEILAARGSWICNKCFQIYKHLSNAEKARRDKRQEKRRATCNHSWEWLSHEERECSKCGEIEFIPDID